MRTTALSCVSGAALFQAAPDRRALVVGVATGLAAWSVVYVRFSSRGWLLPVDTLVIMLLCLTQRWTVPPDAVVDSTNWVLAVVTVTAISAGRGVDRVVARGRGTRLRCLERIVD
ncbi:hypothetical protein ACGFIG_16740 [Micromonospora sp. NPDC049048]|uniref:hypothetical protein n=1 Tax=Micromonospora sp. NPDC049048 TaxID=3364263 RepID=UPI0037181DC4